MNAGRKLVVAIAAVATLVAAGCGNDEPPAAGREAPAPSSSAQPEGSPSAVTRDLTRTASYEVWFHDGERLVVAHRVTEATPGIGTVAMEGLLTGPDEDELDDGIATQIPPGTRLLGLVVEEGVARVDLSGDYELGGGSLSMQMRLAQVVFTLTQFETVQRVSFLLDGEPVESFSGEGIVLDQPLRRKDFENLAPPIVVDQPTPGSEVTSPVTIAGTANVFEATVSITIVDSEGKKLAEAFTTATCGTGCRGDYSKQVEFSVQTPQDGFIEVFESSAEDGSRLHEVRIPVLIMP